MQIAAQGHPRAGAQAHRTEQAPNATITGRYTGKGGRGSPSRSRSDNTDRRELNYSVTPRGRDTFPFDGRVLIPSLLTLINGLSHARHTFGYSPLFFVLHPCAYSFTISPAP